MAGRPAMRIVQALHWLREQGAFFRWDYAHSDQWRPETHAMNPGFSEFLGTTPQDRRDVFLRAAARLGTPEQNGEKDFWVTCVNLKPGFESEEAPQLFFREPTGSVTFQRQTLRLGPGRDPCL